MSRDINGELFKAVQHGNIKKVKSLTNEGANVNALDENRFTPLWYAIIKGHKDIVSFLIENKADVNAQSKAGSRGALLHFAVGKATQTQDIDIIKILLKAEGINVNITDKDGKTPLHYAAEKRNVEVVKVLLKAKGIYVTPQDNNGDTPLNLVTYQRDIVRILETLTMD